MTGPGWTATRLLACWGLQLFGAALGWVSGGMLGWRWLIFVLVVAGIAMLLSAGRPPPASARQPWGLRLLAWLPCLLSSLILAAATVLSWLEAADALILPGQFFLGGICPWIGLSGSHHLAGVPASHWAVAVSAPLLPLLAAAAEQLWRRLPHGVAALPGS